MKKSLQTLAAIAAFAGFLPAAQAQSPTITSAQFPKVGDQQVSYSADTVGIRQGQGGANQTWDFSGLRSNNDSVITYAMAPSATPYAADFPNATVAANSASGQSILYMNLSAGNMEVLGAVISSQNQTIKQKYTNSLIQFTTPMSFNYKHNDLYTGGYNISGIDVYTRGTMNVEADGYGTVLMPGGKTYSKVLRLHAKQVNIDSMDLGFTSQIITTTSESYSFVQQGRRDAVIVITYTTQQSPGGSISAKSITYNNTSPATSGLDENESRGINKFSIYPNPSSARTINIAVTQEKAETYNINVLNQLGQVVRSFNNLGSAEGTNNMTLNLEELPKGLYLIQLQGNAGLAIRKLILE